MKKVVKLTEKDVESLVKKIIKESGNVNEALPRRERERHQTNFRKSSFEPYDREADIMSAFGPYASDLPPNVVSYLRKNPRLFLKRLADVYGMDKFLEFVGHHDNITEELTGPKQGGEDMGQQKPISSSGLKKDVKQTGTELGALAPLEKEAVGKLNLVLKKLNEPGNQIAGNAKNLLGKLFKEFGV